MLINAINSLYPGGNAVYTISIFLVVVMFEAFIYYHVIQNVGRTGGDYVWMSRNLGPILGGAITLGFVFTGLPFIAISLNWLWTLSLGPSASVIGALTGESVSAITTIGGSAVDLLAISVIILALVISIDFVSPKYGYLLLSSFVVIALIGTFMMAAVLIGFSPSSIQSAVASYLPVSGSGSYSGIISGYTGPAFSLTAVFLLLPFAAYSMPWINNASAFSGELKNLKRSALAGTFIPLLVSGGLLAGFIALFYNVVGYNFVLGGAGGLNMLTVATIAMKGNVPFIWVMNIAFAFWYLASLQQTILAISRYALGMSFDRLIPIQLSKVSERFHSPVATLGLTFVVAIPMIVIASYYNYLSLFSTSAMGMIFFGFMGVTAILYAYKKRASLGSTAGALGVSGAIVAIFFFYLSYLYLFVSGLTGYGINDLSWEIMGFFWILGALLYPISRQYYKQKNIDLSVVFKELPPE